MSPRTTAAAVLACGAVLVGATVLLLHRSSASYVPMRATSYPMELLTRPVAEDVPGAERIRRGQYLVRVGDCIACHTSGGGEFLAGGFPLNTPFGTIYSTNITPDPETGIGNWTEEQFFAALHNGKGAHGPLYPAMPYPYTTRVTRQDADAILAFLKTVPSVRESRRTNDLLFPFNVRFLVNGWRALFFDSGEFAADPGKPADWNRGAYLVQGLGHCGACHTPKNALAGDIASRALYGGKLGNWVAPDLTSNMRTGLGRWSIEDIVEYLKTGRNSRANAGAVMGEVVSYSTSILAYEDLRSIATYLKELPASPDAQPAAPEPGAMRGGEAIFSDACTACHLDQGKGQSHLFPPLQDNAVVQQDDPDGMLHIILAGDRTANTGLQPTPLSMPSFAWKLTDKQIADVATYVRNSWGNRAPPVTAVQVADMRRRLRL